MPPKSKSGSIRSAIGLCLSRLNSNSKLGQEFLSKKDQLEAHSFAEQLNITIVKLETSIVSITEKDDKWQQLIRQLNDDEMDAEEELYGTAAFTGDHAYAPVIEDAKETLNLLRSLRNPALPSSVLPSSSDNQKPTASDDAESRSAKRSFCSAKLPKLQLPVFTGNFLEWDNFWTVFDANVHQSSLTGSEKFAYLRAQLRNDACTIIDGLPITDGNYDTAVALLKSRYERAPEQMISNYYSQLIRLPPAANNVSDLSHTYDSCERLFRQLEKSGEDVNTNRSSVLQLFSKFPNCVVKDLFDQFQINSTSSLNQVRHALGEYIRRSEDIGEIFSDLEPYNTGSSKQNRQKSEAQTSESKPFVRPIQPTSTLAASETLVRQHAAKPGSNSPQSPCYFCSGDHFNSKCPAFATADQRIRRLRALGRCERCLAPNHVTADCRTSAKKIWCFFCKTNGCHPSVLCKQKFISGAAASSTITTVEGEEAGKTNQTPKSKQHDIEQTLLTSDERSLLLTALTTISNPSTGAEIQLRLLFDSGSHRSYITESCAQALLLDVETSDSLNVSVFGSKRTLSIETSQVKFAVSLKDGGTQLMTANTTPVITNCPITSERLPDDTKRFINSMQYALADTYDSNNGIIDVLVGSDYLWEFISGIRMIAPGNLYLIPSTLGLLLGGRYKDDTDRNEPVLLCMTDVSHSSQVGNANLGCLNNMATDYPDIDEFWSLETVGIHDNPIELDDDRAMQQFSETVKYQDGRYHVCWPCKDNISQLPSNYSLAYGRFASALKRFRSSDVSMIEKCHAILEDQITKGVIEPVGDGDLHNSVYPVHYLPHHPVVRPGSNTTKVRIVYDASAKARKDNVSLNECLYRGPVILPDLCAILLRFRLGPVAIIADIEKAFLQMGLQESQRDVTRFLWLKDPSKPHPENNTAVFRFCRVPFGVISSPFLLGATIQFHLQQFKTSTASKIAENIYVDNVIVNVDDDASAKTFYDESKQIFRDAGMNLQDWCSNSTTLMNSLPSTDVGRTGDTKILGLTWNTEDDTLRLQISWGSHASCRTKRDVMKATASVFDPLGMFQPCTIAAKCFLRKLWLDEFAWDAVISEPLQSEWKHIHSSITPIFDIRLHRRIPKSPDSTLVAFCDASIQAYSTAVYLRTKSIEDPSSWESHLLFAKSRLAPKSRAHEAVSLPRLELLGLTIGGKAVEFVRSALQDLSMHAFLLTDSTCILHWIRSVKPLSTFVSNRVAGLRSLKNVTFQHVSTTDNPADVATRGISGAELHEYDLWWTGPTWLQKNNTEWPVNTDVLPVSDEIIAEVESGYKRRQVFHTALAGERSTEKSDKPDAEYPFGMDPRRYSSFNKVSRITAWCLKYIRRSSERRLQKPAIELNRFVSNSSSEPSLTADDMYQAKTMWLKAVQQESYSDVFEALKSNKPHQLRKQLNIIVDDEGVLRCFSRYENADLPIECIRPKLLPKNHIITNLIILDTHEFLYHAGVAHTLAQIRREFWIPQGRNAIRGVISKCVQCRKLKGQPFQIPPMPHWPKERLARSTPFCYTGLDYMGPFNVKVGETIKKMWIVLFTCITVRAIHLEWVFDCSAQAFTDALIRFVSRRGFPSQIISDNGSQFHTSNNVFKKMWRSTVADPSVQSYLAQSNIRWKFITSLAPWQGGIYERLVGIVKQSLRAAIGRRLLPWDAFVTVIVEVESIVNNRPLTYVYGDFWSKTVLRPIDFITDLHTARPVMPTSTRPEGGDAEKNLIRHYKYYQARLDSLWKMWYDEYLLSLRERGYMDHRTNSKSVRRHPEVGEVVVIKDSDASRGNWKLGRVTQLIRSKDDAIRSAELTLPNRAVIQRSVTHLYPLEVERSQEDVVIAEEAIDRNNELSSEEPPFDGFDLQDVDEAEKRLYRARTIPDASTTAIDARRYLRNGLSPMAVVTLY